MLLKGWIPLFDLEREHLGVGLIWVSLPWLLLHFWLEDVLICIGNDLGTYMDHEKTYKSYANKSMAHILVHLDTREGLEEKITLHCMHLYRKKILHYEGVPFKRRICHKVGHLYKECPMVLTYDSPSTKGKKHQQPEEP